MRCSRAAAATAGGARPLPRLTVVWVVREPELLGLFAETLAAALREGRLCFALHLHVSAPGAAAAAASVGDAFGASRWPAVERGLCSLSAARAVAAVARPGRPPLRALLADAGGAAAAAFACGPEALMRDVSRKALKEGVRFFAEEFFF